MKRIEYEQRRHDAIARHTGDQYGYYGEMMDVDYDYIASLEARIAELEAEVRVYKFALENAIIDRTLGGNTPLAQYVAEARAELNRQAQEEK